MPRTAKPQANRTDLLTPGPTPGPPPGQGQPNGQPVQVPTNLPYGENQQLQAAQAAVPLPQGGPQAPGLNMSAALAAAKAHAKPNLGSLTRQTERPGEPVNAGLPGGPAPLTGPPVQQGDSSGSVSSMLSKMAAISGSAALSQLAGRASAVGQ